MHAEKRSSRVIVSFFELFVDGSFVLCCILFHQAFGNAKTVRNNNSSRFGRFMQLDVAKGGGIRHGSVLAFLLEKSRILTQVRA